MSFFFTLRAVKCAQNKIILINEKKKHESYTRTAKNKKNNLVTKGDVQK